MIASENALGERMLGLATGVIFGSLLEKGRVSDQDVILRQLILKDWRVVKTMASAVVVGGIGINALAKRGLIRQDIKPMKVGGIVGGAGLFGVGLALLGYCPGTSVAAAGAGRQDALAGVLGMLLGACVFVATFARVSRFTELGGNLGKVTIPTILTTRERPLGQLETNTLRISKV